MLTPSQEQWINHLSDIDRVRILPFDPAVIGKFEKIKKQIQLALGSNIKVVLKGATSLGISGQGELDIYLPVKPEFFDEQVRQVTKIFGKPSSFYSLERARFVLAVDGTKAEIFVINESHKNWLDSGAFENYLRVNKEALDAYRKLKEEGGNMTTREYYRQKIEFINEILAKGV